MKLRYVNPGYKYMITQILEFQKEKISAFWSEPLFYFYPELNRDYVQSLSKVEREKYFEESLRKIYEEKRPVIDEKVVGYNKYWEMCFI